MSELPPADAAGRLPPFPYRRWVEVAVLVAAIAFVAALLAPAILAARATARRAQSANNLRNLVISMHACGNASQRLPAGGRVRDDGTPVSGWFFNMCPYVESSPLYSRVVRYNASWDDPVTRQWLTQPMQLLRNPLLPERETSDGWPLIHYAANPDLFFQNSRIRAADVLATTNAWLIGEVSDRFVPWAYPYNWREPGESVGTPSSTYRNPSGTCQFGMSDGRVVEIPPAGAAVFLEASSRITADVRARSELETPYARLVPPRQFAATSRGSAVVDRVMYSRPDNTTKDDPIIWYQVVTSPDRETVWAYVTAQGTWGRDQILDAIGAAVVQSHAATHVDVPFVSKESLELLRSLPAIRTLVTGSIDGSDETLSALGQHPRLKALVIRRAADPPLQERLEQALPDCEVLWRPEQQ